MKNCKYSMYLRQTKVKIQIMLSRVVDGRGNITNNIRFLISSSVIHSPSIAKRAMYLSKISVNYIEPKKLLIVEKKNRLKCHITITTNNV